MVIYNNGQVDNNNGDDELKSEGDNNGEETFIDGHYSHNPFTKFIDNMCDIYGTYSWNYSMPFTNCNIKTVRKDSCYIEYVVKHPKEKMKYKLLCQDSTICDLFFSMFSLGYCESNKNITKQLHNLKHPIKNYNQLHVSNLII